MKTLLRSILCALALVAFACAPVSQAQTTTNLYAAGVSYNHAATPTVAGTALYAHAISPDTTGGMQAFTVLDILPTGETLNVTTNIGAGVATKVATIGTLPIYVPTDAGITLTGVNTGWNWSGGVMTSYRLPNRNVYILPSVRFLKSSVGGGGYQLIPGILFGWGK